MAAPRDYYADLDLPPTADVSEIKKQYRKLALKYHPDRNPGREQEVNAQFLIIQTAHDVLTDPQQRAKFDATRGRSAAGRASGVRGNPWADVGQQFPTPPRRNQSTRNQASGAERWNTRFSSGVPPTARQHHASNSESKKNAAKAFENMRPRHQAKAGSAAPPPTPPRTASARQRAEASFGTRKTGYQPRASAYGDEPPVTNNNYATRPEPPPRPAPEPATSQKATHQVKPNLRVPDPLSQFRDPSAAADDRQRSPYMAHPGEKTRPFDMDMGQTQASQENRSHADPGSAYVSPSSPGKPQSSPTRPVDPRRPQEAAYASGAQSAKADSYGFPSTSGMPSPESQSQGGQKNPIFNVSDHVGPQSAQTEQKTFTKSSVDDINTSFVNDDGERGSWQFQAGGTEQSSPPMSRPGETHHTDAAQPGKDYPPPPTPEAGGRTGKTQQAQDGRFDADGWNDQFTAQTFVPPPRANSTSSPSKNSRSNSRKSKTTRPVTGENGHNAILIEDSSDEETFTWRGRKGQGYPASTDSPQAMDIDSPPAVTEASSPIPNEPRNIPVEPTRPEWRSGDFSGTGNKPAAEPESKLDKPSAGGSEDSEEFKASFSELRNVAPFASQRSGLKSMSDIKDSLPFESKPSSQIPLGTKATAAPTLAFPEAPQPPRPPLTMGVPSMQTNIPTWEKYVKEFEEYMRQWDAFTGQVTDHFRERKAQIAKMRKEKGYAFLGSRGDTDCVDYFKSVLQDNEVRRRWIAACEEHENHLREFMACREKMQAN